MVAAMSSVQNMKKRPVTVPLSGGIEIALLVPETIDDPTLNKEIAGQDVVRKNLLGFIERIERSIGSNRELFICSEEKLRTITGEFLATCGEISRFIESMATYHSAIPELEEAREDVETFFYSRISSETETTAAYQASVFPEDETLYVDPAKIDLFRKMLAKSAGVVRTELQKIFAYLLERDPRNMYRLAGPRTQKAILFRQFRRDVEITERLYTAVRKLDTYMRGAIVPSDLLQLTAERIEREGSLNCLFQPDYSHFLVALVEEILDQLLSEVQKVLSLDGIWYDDFEEFQGKSKMLQELCSSFKVLFNERSGLREEIAKQEASLSAFGDGLTEVVERLMAVFDNYGHRKIAGIVRSLDQMLVDLEGSLLQWEKGIAKRAFAREEWREAEPLQRRVEKHSAVVFPG